MRWRLLKEEFGPEINYIKGKAKSVALVISRLNYSGLSLDSSANPIGDLFTQEEKEAELFNELNSDC
eukprot:5647585-Ditylum_brightwellii.AAC.1